MKKTLITFFFFLNLVGTYSYSQLFVLNGNIKMGSSGVAELSYWKFERQKSEQVKLTAPIKKGKFLIKGYLKEPVEAELKIADVKTILYIEPTVMTLNMSYKQPDKFNLIGSKTQLECNKLKIAKEKYDQRLERNTLQLHLIDKKLDSLQKANQSLTELSIEKDMFLRQRDSTFNSLAKIMVDAVRSNRNSSYPIVSNLFSIYLSRGYISIDTAKTILERLSPKVKAYQKTIELMEYIQMKTNTSIGSIAPDFKISDFNGKVISLSSFRNKNYVLLDFWASWCSPCIEGMAHLKKLHKLYYSKGLQIIGVSVDRDKEQWLASIEKFHLSEWIQVLGVQNLKKYNDEYVNKEDIVQKYPTDGGVPIYILIDKTGKIIAKWEVYSEENETEQDKLLSEIFRE
ncbi:MAG: TlpA disulfide reductase family protein [Bacteroidales bacterium]|nr:TlpA disulfide reductase family protein [Bacteroidales bacterium]